MILIVGLGNPGPKYQNNRHNVGHQFVDFIAPLLNCSIVKKEKLFSTMKQSNNETIVLAKLQTFMNLSGLAVKKLVSHYPLVPSPQSLIIIHDDLDIPLGKFHIQFASGPQLHNGIESVEQHLKTKDFWRVRIGVDNRLPDKKIPGEAYTLQNFLFDEKKLLATEIFPKIFEQLKVDLKNQFKVII
ncbi:MAG: aminoacyl-tRNA hydrolase [Candidatus Roizmanbacteria bacterium]|nr:aminoacyl-tRNA hydrolase [Candidatus Roizmanbacteria bacterium]